MDPKNNGEIEKGTSRSNSAYLLRTYYVPGTSHLIPTPHNSPRGKYYYRWEKGKLREVRGFPQDHPATMSGRDLSTDLSSTKEEET